MTSPAEAIAIDDVQALIVRGFRSFPASCYLALRLGDLRGARAWLAQIAAEASSAATPLLSCDRHLNVAFTTTGLERLGLPASALAGFRSAFLEGAAASPHRSRLLGDVEASAPEHWEWGHGQRALDVALLLFARDVAELAAFIRFQRDRLDKYGLSVVAELSSGELPGRKEHFGFRDGIAQPALRNANPPDERPGVLEADTAANTVEPGEFLFGYVNAYGAVARGPEVPAELDPEHHLPASTRAPALRDFARNGSFMVWRQLEQHVHAFWDAIRRSCPGDPAARRLLAAKLVGRWPSGAPLALAPDLESSALQDANGFGYAADDPHGYRTPFGAHIRRSNPRDWILSRDPERSRRIANAHRIIRRGRPYGEPVDASMEPEAILAQKDDGRPRGMQFVCFMADIERQFELIQGTWLTDPKFAGLADETDPILGAGPARTAFTVQAPPIARRLHGLARFVTVRGGAYLFMPGIRALHFLASLRSDPTPALTEAR